MHRLLITIAVIMRARLLLSVTAVPPQKMSSAAVVTLFVLTVSVKGGPPSYSADGQCFLAQQFALRAAHGPYS